LTEVVILSAARTPFGRLLGSLADLPATALGSRAVIGALERARIRPEDIERVFLGNINAYSLRGNPAAAVAKEAGLSPSIPSMTVRAGCASGMMAAVSAMDSIQAGGCQTAIAGGFESVSSAPHLAPSLRRGLRLGAGTLLDASRHDGPSGHPIGAELEMEGFLSAEREGMSASSIVPVEISAVKRGTPAIVARDEAATGIRLTDLLNAPELAAPPLADGAAALVLASPVWAAERGLKPLARLRRISVPVAREIAGSRFIEADLPRKEAEDLLKALPEERARSVNSRGGAGILGHATGADGARLLVSLLTLLMHAGGGRGLAVAGGGWGEVAGVVVEV
jgi:acetyl-CoA C-acetyltransferase